MTQQCCPQNSLSAPTWTYCPWDADTKLSEHRLQFHFRHDPRFQIFWHLASTQSGHNAISYLLSHHEARLSKERLGIAYDEAILYTVAHLLFLSLAGASNTEQNRASVAVSADEDLDQVNFGETGLLSAPGRASYGQSEFGIHLSTLIRSVGLTIGVADVEAALRALHDGRVFDDDPCRVRCC